MKLLFRNLIFLLFFALCYIAPSSAVTDFYSDCIKNYDYGNVDVEIVEVPPLNSSCKKLCSDECVIFSRFDKSATQLNDDIVNDCKSSCQRGDIDASGQYFSSYYREEAVINGNETIAFSGPLSISEACVDKDERERNAVDTGMSGFKDGDKITIRLANGAQQVHMCGKKSIHYKPLISSSDVAIWESNSKQNIYQGKDEHICLTYIPQERFEDLTFRDLWNEFEKPEYADEKFEKCRWHARNHRYTPTGIIPQDGDDLTISWQGDYGYTRAQIGTIDSPRNNMMTRDEVLFCLDPVNKDIIDQTKKNLCEVFFRAISGLQFYNSGVLNSNQRANPFFTSVFGEDLRIPKFNILAVKGRNCNSGTANNPEIKLKGLLGKLIDENLQVALAGIDSNCETRPDYACNNVDNCFKISTMGRGHYIFSGAVNSSEHNLNSGNALDFSSRSELYLRHYDTTSNSANQQAINYQDNVGGYDLKIAWGGCPMSDGEGLQYAIWDQNASTADLEDKWQDIPQNILFGKEAFVVSSSYTGSEGGTLYLRIKGNDSSITGPHQDLYENYGNRFGEYNIALKRFGTYGVVDKNNPFRKLVILVKETILGYEEPSGGYVDGATQIVYKKVVSDYKFVQMVQALLVFYVAMQAVLFIIGVVNINRKEFVVRIFKIAVIVAIISPGSWEFLYFNFLKGFIDGSIELIALIVSSAYPDVPGVDIQKDPTLIFSIFGAVNAMVFNNAIWIKIAALMTNGLVGLTIAIVILIAIIIYWLCIIRAVVMYIFSLIGISLLILLAPIFMPLMLFKMTESFFNSWWKLILSFALQPVMVFATITIFNVLMITLLYSSLNFTACKSCLWEMSIPFINYNECWIPSYRIVHNLHLPGEFSGTFLPLNVLGAGLSFLLLAHGMWVFTGFITQITSRIVTQMFIRSATVSGQEEGMRQDAVEVVKFGADSAIGGIIATVQHAKKRYAKQARRRLARGLPSGRVPQNGPNNRPGNN